MTMTKKYENRKFIEMLHDKLPEEIACDIQGAFLERCGKAGAHGSIHYYEENKLIDRIVAKLLISQLNKTRDEWEIEYLELGGSPVTLGEFTLDPDDCYLECFDNNDNLRLETVLDINLSDIMDEDERRGRREKEERNASI